MRTRQTNSAVGIAAITGGTATGLTAFSMASGQELMPDGGVSNPSYSFTSSTNTGMFVASGQLCLGLAGAVGYQIISGTLQQLSINTKMNAKRFLNAQGAAVASAANLTLGGDGNYFQISGTTGISLLDNTNWLGGSLVTLKFNGALTITNNVAASGNFKPIVLNAGANLTTAANNTLTLVYDATDATWHEVARKV